MACLTVTLALCAVALDEAVGEDWLERMGWIYSGGAEGARQLLSTVAGSMIAIPGTVFSMTLVAMSLASSKLGPRLLRTFMRDTANQVVLGSFGATFVYCLLVLRTNRRGDEGAFVPHLSISIGVLLAMVSIGVLIYFIHHVSVSIQAKEVVARDSRAQEDGIGRLFPGRLGKPASEVSKGASRKWRDEEGRTRLETPPLISMLPLIGFQREPRPITWAEQRRLLPHLADHLAKMVLFDLNTGARDEVVCGLKWEWEIYIPELERSVFDVPRENVKGRKRSRVLVCNSVAQSIIEGQRGKHAEYVFPYQGKRIEMMSNNGWQRARKAAGLPDLHIHDLRHTVGMRLREAGVREETIADVLWHTRRGMTAHYSVAQIEELLDALERITDERSRTNRSLEMIRREQLGRLSPQKVPTESKKANQRLA